tara:strand:+ start:13678 stop:14574 length:897 start_codon:yes stop_codon:yes gene_type:complete
MNNAPFYYDYLWKEHEIEYLKFNGYTFINDLSYTKDNCKSNILLFNYEGSNILRGYRDGIMFPQINYFDIENIHTKKRDKKIQNILDYILKIFDDYNIVNTKIYQDPYLCKKLGYSIFDLLDLKQLKLKYKLEMYFEKSEKKSILNSLKGETRTIVKKYLNNTKFNVYFGDVSNIIFNSFIDKHLELSGKKTKSEKCWLMLKNMIKEKKAILLVSDNNYILYCVSNNYCYYAINACTKRDSIVSYLLYSGLLWLTENNFKFIHFGTLKNFVSGEKNINISRFKNSFCNKMFTQYYLEI